MEDKQKRIQLSHGSARVSENVSEETVKWLEELCRRAYWLNTEPDEEAVSPQARIVGIYKDQVKARKHLGGKPYTEDQIQKLQSELDCLVVNQADGSRPLLPDECKRLSELKQDRRLTAKSPDQIIQDWKLSETTRGRSRKDYTTK